MPPVKFDPWDQAQLTAMVKRSLTVGKEGSVSPASQIAPSVDVQSRKVKFRIVEVDAFGVGQFRAPEGNPRQFRSRQRVRDEVIELLLPDEMERINEDTMLQLLSSDPVISQGAGVDIVTRGKILATRNWRAIEKMRWDALLSGQFNVTFDNGSRETIAFDVPSDHFVTPSTLWTNTASADIVGNVRAWQKKLADDIGFLGTKIHMNSDTWELVYNNAGIRSLLSSYGRSLLVPTKDEISKLFRNEPEIIIYDGGYRDTLADSVYEGANPNKARGDSNLTKWIPYGKVLITTDYVLDGERIADTPNGQVMVATGYNSATPVQGPASEMLLDPISHNTNLRHASAAVPRLLIPEAFFVATVV